MKRKIKEEKLSPCEEKALVTLQANEIKEKRQKAKARARKKAKLGPKVQIGAQGGVALGGQNLPFFMPSAPAAMTSFTPSFTAPAAKVPSEWSNIAANLSQTALQYALFNQGNWKKETQASQGISRAVGPGPVMKSQGVNTAPPIPPRPPKIKQEDPLRPPKIQQPVEIPFGPWFFDPNSNMNRADYDPRYRKLLQNTQLKRDSVARKEVGQVIQQKQELRTKAKFFETLKNTQLKARANKFITNIPGLGFTPSKNEIIDPDKIITKSSASKTEIIDPDRILKTPSKQNEEKSIELTPIGQSLNTKEYDIIYGSGGTVTGGLPRNSKQVSFFTDSTQPNTPSSNSDVYNPRTPSSSKSPATPASAYYTPSTPASAYYTPKPGYDYDSERFSTPITNTFSSKKMLEYGSANGVPIFAPINEQNPPITPLSASFSPNASILSSPDDISGFNPYKIDTSSQRQNMAGAAALQQQLVERTNQIRAQKEQQDLQAQINEQNQIKVAAIQDQAVQAKLAAQVVDNNMSMYQRRQLEPRQRRSSIQGPIELTGPSGKGPLSLTSTVRTMLNE